MTNRRRNRQRQDADLQDPSSKGVSPENAGDDQPSQRPSTLAAQTLAVPWQIRHPMSTSTLRPLLVASLGNPSPHANSLHSAGHHVIDTVRAHLGMPSFSSKVLRPGKAATGSLTHQHITLWQSPAVMNVSGPVVARTWKSFLSTLLPDQRDTKSEGGARLVVVHDELEAPLGTVKLRWGGSAKGHNGLKSCVESLGGQQAFWCRVGVGIGRPESREKGDVSR